MAQNRGRQKKQEKKRKKREVAKRSARATSGQRQAARRQELVRRALRYPFGPSYISKDYVDENAPALVTVVVTRRAGDGRVLPLVALVDRTCLGVKSGYLGAPQEHASLVEMLDEVGALHGGMLECELLLAQSVIFHALDYAHSLGFAPDPDFAVEVLGPRPEKLLDTPWAKPAKPYYAAGPNDDAAKIIQTLEARLGSGNFDVTMANLGAFGGFEFLGDAEDDEGEFDDEFEDESDGEAIEGEGEVVKE